jgi:predicted ATPase
MKVVGLSGAQGGGKSSLLAELQRRGWLVDSFRVSRAVQAALGWDSLDRVKESFETMASFQEEVFFQKHRNDFALHEKACARTMDPKGHVVLTERTFADINAYTNLWTWGFVDNEQVSLAHAIDFLRGYTHDCAEAHAKIYHATLLMPLMDHIPWENDPNRAKREDAQSVYEDIERFVDRKTHIMHPRHRITSKSVEERADEVETFLAGYGL